MIHSFPKSMKNAENANEYIRRKYEEFFPKYEKIYIPFSSDVISVPGYSMTGAEWQMKGVDTILYFQHEKYPYLVFLDEKVTDQKYVFEKDGTHRGVAFEIYSDFERMKCGWGTDNTKITDYVVFVSPEINYIEFYALTLMRAEYRKRFLKNENIPLPARNEDGNMGIITLLPYEKLLANPHEI